MCYSKLNDTEVSDMEKEKIIRKLSTQINSGGHIIGAVRGMGNHIAERFAKEKFGEVISAYKILNIASYQVFLPFTMFDRLSIAVEKHGVDWRYMQNAFCRPIACRYSSFMIIQKTQRFQLINIRVIACFGEF